MSKAVPQGPVFDFRLAMGLLGILLAAMLSGLNSRIVGLALLDVQGAMHMSHDIASWMDTLYSAGELAAMPFASWFAITFSLRRFHIAMLAGVIVIGIFLPFIHHPCAMYAARLLQGVFSGALIPLLMMSALRFLPPPIRLHGLALYALTATFSPNVALWLTGAIISNLHDWRWIFWEVVPLGLLSAGLVYYGIPKMPPALPRLKQANWMGLVIGVCGLICLAIGIGQGSRLDWFNSPVIQAAFFAGSGLLLLFGISEWFHPAPFVRFQLLAKRNIGIGFIIFFFMLIAMTTAVGFPASILQQLHHLKVEQTASLGLIVGLPQLILGSVIAILLYQKWVDARVIFIIGLLLMATASGLASFITHEWKMQEFVLIECLYALGMPMAIVCLLFMSTSVVVPSEGPFLSGIINTLRSLGTLAGSALIGQFLSDSTRTNQLYMLDEASGWRAMPGTDVTSAVANLFTREATVIAASDIFVFFAGLFLILVPLVMCLQYIPAPVMQNTAVNKPKES